MKALHERATLARRAIPGAKSTLMVTRRCAASNSTALTNQGALMPRAVANNWLVIAISRHLAVAPSEGGERHCVNRGSRQPVDLWTAGDGEQIVSSVSRRS